MTDPIASAKEEAYFGYIASAKEDAGDGSVATAEEEESGDEFYRYN